MDEPSNGCESTTVEAADGTAIVTEVCTQSCDTENCNSGVPAPPTEAPAPTEPAPPATEAPPPAPETEAPPADPEPEDDKRSSPGGGAGAVKMSFFGAII